MFGNFAENFGLNFPVDNQGGLFPQQAAPAAPGVDQGGLTAAPLSPSPATTASPAAGIPGGAPSPMASPLAPGQATQAAVATDQPSAAAPAAGLASPFGKAL
jgi:hypothetical protein